MNITDSKFFIPALMVIVMVVGFLVFGNLIMDKIADKVLERIQKPYSPSPFGAGFDPDKLDGHRGVSYRPLEVSEPQSRNWTNEWEYTRDN